MCKPSRFEGSFDAIISTLEFSWSDHHGGGLQGVTGSSEVMPLDTVEFADVVTHCVVDSIQVGETTCIKPPALKKEKYTRYSEY